MNETETAKDATEEFGYPPLIHGIGLALSLAVFWLLLSGYLLPLILFLGLASVALCVWIGMRMDLVDHEGVPIHLTWSALRYWPWLIWEIVKANLDVSRRVLSPSLPISPVLFETPSTQKSELGQVIYANSITLTPGTVSVGLQPGLVRVHALSREGADGVLEGEMNRRVTGIEGLPGE